MKSNEVLHRQYIHPTALVANADTFFLARHRRNHQVTLSNRQNSGRISSWCVSTAALITALVLSLFVFGSRAAAQSPESTDPTLAKRYLQALLRRPRPGTILERLYNEHARNDSIIELTRSLNVDPKHPEVGSRLFLLGLIQMQRGQLEDAIRALSEAEEHLKTDAFVSYSLGKTLQSIGKTDEAINALERSIERGPLRHEMAEIYLALAKLYLREDRVEAAEATWKTLQDRFAGDVSIAERIAKQLLDEGRLEKALQRYERLSRVAKASNEQVRFALQVAEINQKLGHHDAALEQLKQLLFSLRPTSWLYRDVQNRLEKTFIDRFDFAGAIAVYQQVVKRRPDELALIIRLGQLQMYAGQLDQSEITLKEAMGKAPSSIDVREALIEVCTRAGKYNAASEHFETLVQLQPNNAEHYVRWGQISLRHLDLPIEKRRAKSFEIWNRLAKRKQDDAGTCVRVARLMSSINRIERATELYQRAIQLRPDEAAFREYLGEHYYQQKKTDAALAAWESIASGERRNRDSVIRLAEVFAQFGFGERSIACWGVAADSFDLSLSQRIDAANAFSRAKRFDEALRQLDIAIMIAETADEQDRVLRRQVAIYHEIGELFEKANEIRSRKPTLVNRRLLAMLYLAANEFTQAERALKQAQALAANDPLLLTLSAEIAEAQSHYSLAIEIYRQLMELDPRRQSHYLRQIIQLELSRNDYRAALRSSGQLTKIDSTSADAYRVFADVAFLLNRDEEAAASLRTAISLAPRENAYRLRLARHYVASSKLDLAIEIYWQAMEYESDWSGQRQLLRLMVPHYKEQQELDTLMARIEQFHAATNDRFMTKRFMATAWQIAGNDAYGAHLLSELLSEQPDDVDLLREIVSAYESMRDYRRANRYQSHLATIDGTTETLDKLEQLSRKAGIIRNGMEQFEQQLLQASQPDQIKNLIRQAAVLDAEGAVELCRKALRRDASLWGIKCLLAQLLLEAGSDSTTRNYREAQRLAMQLLELDLKSDELPPSNRPRFSGSTAPLIRTPKKYRVTERTQWRSGSGPNTKTTLIEKADFPKYMGSVLSLVRGGTRGSIPVGKRLLPPEDYNQAAWICRGVQIVAQFRLESLQGITPDLEKISNDVIPTPEFDQTASEQILETITAKIQLIGSLTGNQSPIPTALIWRLVELFPSKPNEELRKMLWARNKTRIQKQRLRSVTGRMLRAGSGRSGPPTPPLSSAQLGTLTKHIAGYCRGIEPSKLNREQLAQELMFRRCAIEEYLRAGVKPPLCRLTHDVDFPLNALIAVADIQIDLWCGEHEYADSLASQLADLARRDNQTELLKEIEGIDLLTWPLSADDKAEVEFVRRWRGQLIGFWIAHSSRRQQLLAKSNSRARLNNWFRSGVAETSIPEIIAGRVLNTGKSQPVHTTLSTRLIDTELVRALLPLIGQYDSSPDADHPFPIPPEFWEDLESLPGDVPQQELRLRSVVAAFGWWWAGDRDRCERALVESLEQFPDDVSISIEIARLQIEREKPDLAFQRLDGLKPRDPIEEAQVELARINLASWIGIDRIVQRAAQELASFDIYQVKADTTTTKPIDRHRPAEWRHPTEQRCPTEQCPTEQSLNRTSLANRTMNNVTQQNNAGQQNSLVQLNRAIPPSTAIAPLMINARNRNRPQHLTLFPATSMGKLRQAEKYAANGNPLTASEIAISLIDLYAHDPLPLMRSNVQRAIQLVTQADRLDALIDETEQAWNSDKPLDGQRDLLTELYLQAGRVADAERLWEQLAESKHSLANPFISSAISCQQRKQHHQAAVLFLCAFERAPSQWSKHWPAFVESAEQSAYQESIFRRLSEMDTSAFSVFSLCNVMQIRQEESFSAMQRAFVKHLVQSHPDAESKRALFERFIPEQELEAFAGWYKTDQPTNN